MIDDQEYDLHLHHELKQKRMRYIKRGLCGLVNLGNKCYMNSILQCLSNTPKLTDYFLCGDYNKDNVENVLMQRHEFQFVASYRNLLENIWHSNKLIKPKSFTETLSKYVPKFGSIEQQDSHECLLYILELLHKGISYEIEVDIQGVVKNDTDKLMKQSLEAWRMHYQKQFSQISEIFNGMYYNRIQCNNCNFIENVFEPYSTLNVDIPTNLKSSLNLIDCLKESFRNEECIETWLCEKCNKNGCNRNSKLWTLPNYLIIHIKRFGNTGRKLNNHISFTLDDINLSEFISSDKNDPNNYIYSLYAINYHSGSLNAGHYWSCCKNMDNDWYLYNDGHVSRFHQVNDLLSKDAYILFYYRKFIKNTSYEKN